MLNEGTETYLQHSSMQVEWNICRQLLGRATMSVGRRPSLHMAHCGKNLLT